MRQNNFKQFFKTINFWVCFQGDWEYLSLKINSYISLSFAS